MKVWGLRFMVEGIESNTSTSIVLVGLVRNLCISFAFVGGQKQSSSS